MNLVPEEARHLSIQGRLARHLVSSKLWDQVDAVSIESSGRMKEKPLHMPPGQKSRSSRAAHSFGHSASPSLNPEVYQKLKHHHVVPKWLYSMAAWLPSKYLKISCRHLCETLEGMVKEQLVKLVTLLHPLLKFEVKLKPPEHLLKMLT
jgi:hypothetical protein